MKRRLAAPAVGVMLLGSAIAQTPPELAAFDELVAGIMSKYHLPGAQLAIAKDGRLVLNRGYGYSDVDRKEQVRPDMLFRIFSVSKPITVVAIMTLVERGYLRLEDKAFRILADLKPPAGATVDPRLFNITVQDLLQHAGGWDSAKSFDPMFPPWSRMAAATLGRKDPPECETIIRYMMSVPLDFDPGTKTVYSNFGYCVLGRIIEKTVAARTGKAMSYEQYVKSAVLKPAGITDMRIGGTRLSERAKGEVRYYHQPNQTELPYATPSVFPGEGYVPWAYGGYYLRGTDAHGGWIGSAADLVQFAAAIDGQRGPALLQPATVQIMVNTPIPHATPPRTGLGWSVKRVGEKFDLSHGGALQGEWRVSAAPPSRWRYLGIHLQFLTAGLRQVLRRCVSEI